MKTYYFYISALEAKVSMVIREGGKKGAAHYWICKVLYSPEPCCSRLLFCELDAKCKGYFKTYESMTSTENNQLKWFIPRLLKAALVNDYEMKCISALLP